MIKRTTRIIFISLFVFIGKNAKAQINDTFRYVSDAYQTWTVPGCVTQVTLQLWGGGGGSGHQAAYHDDWCGGSGAYMEGVLYGLTAGEVLKLYVPHGGYYYTFNIYAPGGWPGGGEAGSDNSFAEYGGGGGGYAGVKIDTTYYAIAGGGGGGGSTEYGGSAYGGGGGATTGGSGITSFGGAGQGGTLFAGGAGGTGYSMRGEAGLYLKGGNGATMYYNGNYGGGAGGGGYYGGGGGGDEGNSGGGGSSFPGSTYTFNGFVFTPGINTQGNINNGNSGRALAPNFPPHGIGDAPIDSSGGNGLIVITYTGNAIPLTSVISGKTNPTCGICDGSIAVTASGGGGAYTYLWMPTGQTNALATGLCAGNYTITVTDSCGDVSTTPVLLLANPIMVTTRFITNNKCNGNCTGSATVTVGIGTPPYTYRWLPGGESTATATSLCAGTYTVIVTDRNGCSNTAEVTITQPPAITTSVTIGNVLCYGDTGSAGISVSGGVSPYTYLWNPAGQTTANATGLSVGLYTVTITDSNGCTVTTIATITQPWLLKLMPL